MSIPLPGSTYEDFKPYGASYEEPQSQVESSVTWTKEEEDYALEDMEELKLEVDRCAERSLDQQAYYYGGIQ